MSLLVLRRLVSTQFTAVTAAASSSSSSSLPCCLTARRSFHSSSSAWAVIDRAASLRRVSDASARPSAKGRAAENSAADARERVRADAEAAAKIVAELEQLERNEMEEGRRSSSYSRSSRSNQSRSMDDSMKPKAINHGTEQRPFMRRPRRPPGANFDPANNKPLQETWPPERITLICKELMVAGKSGRPMSTELLTSPEAKAAAEEARKEVEEAKRVKMEHEKAVKEALAAGRPPPELVAPVVSPSSPSLSPSAASSLRNASVEYAFPKLNSFERHLVHKIAAEIGGGDIEHGSVGMGAAKHIVLRYVGPRDA